MERGNHDNNILEVLVVTSDSNCTSLLPNSHLLHNMLTAKNQYRTVHAAVNTRPTSLPPTRIS